jgi:hypothetical protein
MKHILIINGLGGSGKDQFVTYCSQFLSVYNISSVDKVKEAAKILGWNGEKDEMSRWFLSMLKYLSSKYNDYPYKHIENRINYFLGNSKHDIMFIHIREPEEIDRVKNNFGCKTILIKNNNIDPITTNDADAGVENYNYDFVIDNSGTLGDLKKKAFGFINIIIGE